MKYSIEIGKIVEGALKHDKVKVQSYTKQLIEKLESNDDVRTANKFSKLLSMQSDATLSAMNIRDVANIPVDMESRTMLADVIYPYENDNEVILSSENKKKLDSFILSYKNADELNSLGVGVANTLLLYGPPGCGKTKSAYLIARELELPLVIARLDSLISSYLGTTAKNIRTLFEYAQQVPCVLFLDEFDALAKARDDSNELGELKRVVNSLLQNVDAMSHDSLLIAATNHENLLDSAAWRRFDYKLKIELPDFQSIEKMIDIFSNGTGEFDEKTKHNLAIAFEGLSGADIEEIIKKSIRNKVIHRLDYSLTNVYDEYFLYINLIPQQIDNQKHILKMKANYLREKNSKVFSYQSIADALNVSKTQVSNLLQESDRNE